jgi:CxxC motif-containing protein (DUF1111 family)
MRKVLVALLVLAAATEVIAQRVTGFRGPRPVVGEPPVVQPPPEPARLGEPLQGLTASQLFAFEQGLGEFDRVRTPQDGLGPIFNAPSCEACHRQPVTGAAGQRRVTRFGTTGSNGKFDPLDRLGGSLFQDDVIGPPVGSPRRFTPERVPSQATIITTRRTTSLLGLGFVDATPDATFIALAAQQAARNPATAGRVAMVQNISAGGLTVGKLGWKAQVPTLRQFAGDALSNEMGITNPQFPNENCPNSDCSEMRFNPAPGLNDVGQSVQMLTNFMALLAPPAPLRPTPASLAGRSVFERIGCAECHVPTLQAGPYPVAAIANQSYSPYSDFLLHDMGAAGDGIGQGDASGSELRTAPLWGLRHGRGFMHDGNSLSIEAAIVRHDGQGRASREAFQALDATARAQLMAFLEGL